MISRLHGFPDDLNEPYWLFPDDSPLKAHPHNKAAKAGDMNAAVHLVADLALPLLRPDIIMHGGTVAAVLVLVNAGRVKHLRPAKPLVRKIQSRYGPEIHEIFGIDPAALTANEANYLVGFRSVDEIRNRLAKAREETDRRVHSKRT